MINNKLANYTRLKHLHVRPSKAVHLALVCLHPAFGALDPHMQHTHM